MLRQLELADDLRTQEGDDVGEDAEAVARHDLLGDGRTAEDVTAFQDQDRLAGLREVGRGHEAVVASADHDGVVALRHPAPSLAASGPGPSEKAIRTPAGARPPMLAAGLPPAARPP